MSWFQAISHVPDLDSEQLMMISGRIGSSIQLASPMLALPDRPTHVLPVVLSLFALKALDVHHPSLENSWRSSKIIENPCRGT